METARRYQVCHSRAAERSTGPRGFPAGNCPDLLRPTTGHMSQSHLGHSRSVSTHTAHVSSPTATNIVRTHPCGTSTRLPCPTCSWDESEAVRKELAPGGRARSPMARGWGWGGVRVHPRHSGTPQAHHAFKPVPRGSKGLAPPHSAASGSAPEPAAGHAASGPGHLTRGPTTGHGRPALLPRRPVR